MSSYIIAGSSQNPDTAYCQEVANKIKAKYSNIDFRIIIKHPSQWDAHIQQVCRIYGFPRKQNPIIYTFDGKMIGDKHAFLTTCRKYFGISEKQMGIGIISTKVNKKIAEEELNKKMKKLKGEKTMLEVIDQKLQEKMNGKLFSYRLPDYKKTIEKGLIFFIKEVDGMVASIQFEVEKIQEVVKQEIKEEEIDLVAISQNDRIPVVQQHKSGNHSEKEKDPFLTHQHQQDRKSRTNGSQKLHDSMHSKSHISHEGGLKRSSVIKDRSNSIRPQVTEDPKPQFDLLNFENYVVMDLEDDHYLIFNQKPIILGSLKVVKSAPTQNGMFELDHTNYPRKVIGHVYDKEPKIVVDINRQEDVLSEHEDEGKEKREEEHKGDNQNELKVQQDAIRKIESQNVSSVQPSDVNNSAVKEESNPPEEPVKKQEAEAEAQAQSKQYQQHKDDDHHDNKTNLDNSQFEFKNKKLRTEVDVRQFEQKKKKKVRKGSMQPRDKYMTGNILDKLEHSQVDFAEAGAQQSDKKALNFLQPMTNEEIEKTYNILSNSNAIAVLQFKPQNPNPIIDIHLRKHLNSATINSLKELPLPIEEVLLSSLQQGELTPIQPESPIGFIQKLMFAHLIAQVSSADLIPDLIHQMLTFLLKLETKLERLIGYNIIMAQKYILITPLINHFDIYNGQKLYVNALASIGIVHIPKLNSPFLIEKRELQSPYEYIRICSGEIESIEDLVDS